MKYLCQFSTICALVVTLGACQNLTTRPFNSQPDPAAINSAQAESEADTAFGDSMGEMPEDSSDIVLAAAMPGAEDDELDPDYADVGTLAELKPPISEGLAEAQAIEADLWRRIREGFALEHHLNEARVQSEIRWYANHPE